VYFNQLVREYEEKLPSGIFIAPDMDESIDQHAALTMAENIFKRICPDEEFIAKVPDPNDVEWVSDEEAEPEADTEKSETKEEEKPAPHNE